MDEDSNLYPSKLMVPPYTWNFTPSYEFQMYLWLFNSLSWEMNMPECLSRYYNINWEVFIINIKVKTHIALLEIIQNWYQCLVISSSL